MGWSMCGCICIVIVWFCYLKDGVGMDSLMIGWFGIFVVVIDFVVWVVVVFVCCLVWVFYWLVLSCCLLLWIVDVDLNWFLVVLVVGYLVVFGVLCDLVIGYLYIVIVLLVLVVVCLYIVVWLWWWWVMIVVCCWWCEVWLICIGWFVGYVVWIGGVIYGWGGLGWGGV